MLRKRDVFTSLQSTAVQAGRKGGFAQAKTLPLWHTNHFCTAKNVQGAKMILSGIQPTGTPHIGNYLGALRKWVALQDVSHNAGNRNLYFLADLHALTVPQDPKLLNQNIYDMTASLLACGLDPNKSTIFQQSDVAGHAELTWILMCYASMGQLNRMTQFKTKADSR